MAITLIQFWQQELDVYQVEQATAQSDVALAQETVKSLNAQLATDLKALDKINADIAAARAKLAVTTVPAEANALVDAITTLIIQQRGLQGAVLDDRDALDWAQADTDSAAATLARATAKVAGARAGLTKAQDKDAQRQLFKQAVGAPPLNSLKADVTAFQAGTTVPNATSRINKDFTPELTTLAKRRHDTRTKRLQGLRAAVDKAEDALGSELATDQGLDGVAAQKQIAFHRAERLLREYVATASDRFAKAKTTVQALEAIELDTTGTVPDVLTVAEKAQVTAKKAVGAVAVPTAEAIDTDLNAVFSARDDLDAQILTQISANVDNLSTDPTVQAKREAIGNKILALQNDQTNFVAANKKDLDQWEAVIPDPAWQVLLDFDEGGAALSELAATDPAALASAMDMAENEYAAALASAAVARRRVDYLGDAIAVRQARLDSSTAAIASRLPSAIRGDSF